ncbi:hypothetical protein JZ751_014319 [Albula glossodonta]|uniref:Uncharacterized protein n=1 Tax=Albula glossodonta TaxID=121402 RepID=A0A8T2P119_9TELE|nr:hypothetical protein JZ751_014319 [Albula glossodonta]
MDDGALVYSGAERRLTMLEGRLASLIRPETVKMVAALLLSLRPLLVWSKRNTTAVYPATPRTVAPPPAKSTIPVTAMSSRVAPGVGRGGDRPSRKEPQTSRATPVSRMRAWSDGPPLLRARMRPQLRTQPMSCTAELSSCFSSTASASRHSATPTPSRHAPDVLVVEERTPTPPAPQARTSVTDTQ